jgi:hypothetical protein
MPPRIHRTLRLSIHDNGLIMSPETGDSVLLQWGIKGRLVDIAGDAEGNGVGVDIGGILGVVKLWDGALFA